MRVIVEVLSGPSAGQRKWFGPGQSLRVGRGDRADLVIGRDSQMSSLHFAIDCRAGDCLVRDLGSTNGTFVDGAKIAERELRSAATILAGETEFALHIEEATPALAGQPPDAPDADATEVREGGTPPPQARVIPAAVAVQEAASLVRLILNIAAGPALAQRHEIVPGRPFHLGRAPDCELPIAADKLLSGHHCVIESRAGAWHVRDLGSTNGTQVNNAPASDVPLRDGDEISAGNSRFRVHFAADEDEEAAQSVVEETVVIPPPPPSGQEPDEEEEPEPAETPEFQLPVMQIVNRTALAVETLLWEDADGQAKLTVVAKATFAMSDGQPCTLAEKPLPIFAADAPFEDDPAAPPRFESDLVPYKPLVDVVLVGKAHAPGGLPATQLDVSLSVGSLHRTLRVFGDRKWWFPTRLAVVPEVSPPEPFVSMDLVYARAFGGIDADAALYCAENLAGRGFIGKKSRESVHEKPLPNLENPADLIDSWSSQPKPVGFGFYGRNWQPRAAFAGTYNEAYYQERAPKPPVDFSDRFYNGAHPDLQVPGYLRGDEAVELANVSSQFATLKFRLPGIRPKIRVAKWTTDPTDWLEAQLDQRNDPAQQALPLAETSHDTVLDTLVFVPDEGILYEVFRAVIPLGDPDALEIATVTISTQ